MNENSNLIKKVYFTILYLNCLKHPPTTFEVWQHFLDFSENGEEISFWEVSSSIKKLKIKNKIFLEKGFWLTKSQTSGLGKRRIICQKNSIIKLKKIKKRLDWIKFSPFVRAIFVTGTLSFKTASKDSDWDVLVLMKKNRIWLGRLILTSFLILTGQKRTDLKIKNRFCLNHFLTEKNLIPANRNEYTSLESTFIFPVLNEKLFYNFIRLNWSWLRKFNPNFQFYRFNKSKFLVNENHSKKARNLFETSLEAFGVAGFLNRLCQEWMIKRIAKKSKDFSSEAVIIYNDGELAFWPEFKNLNKILKI